MCVRVLCVSVCACVRVYKCAQTDIFPPSRTQTTSTCTRARRAPGASPFPSRGRARRSWTSSTADTATPRADTRCARSHALPITFTCSFCQVLLCFCRAWLGLNETNKTDKNYKVLWVLVVFQVSKEGEYGIHVKYNDEHVPDSPAMVYIAPEAGDAKLVTVHGLRDRGLEVRRGEGRAG